MSGLLYLVQRRGVWTDCSPAQSAPRCTVPNVTAHLLTASVPIAVLLYDGPLLCGFNVAIKGLNISTKGQFVRMITAGSDNVFASYHKNVHAVTNKQLQYCVLRL